MAETKDQRANQDTRFQLDNNRAALEEIRRRAFEKNKSSEPPKRLPLTPPSAPANPRHIPIQKYAEGGILGGLYSFGDSLKRNVKDFVRSPNDYIAQASDEIRRRMRTEPEKVEIKEMRKGKAWTPPSTTIPSSPPVAESTGVPAVRASVTPRKTLPSLGHSRESIP